MKELIIKILSVIIWAILACIMIDSFLTLLIVPGILSKIVSIFIMIVFIFVTYASNFFTDWDKYNKIINGDID